MKTTNFNHLARYETQMGWRLVVKPIKMELERVNLYPNGMLTEIVDRLSLLSKDQAIETNYEAFTNSNISSMHQIAKMQGFKLHVLRSGNKRILYVDKKDIA